MVSSTGKMNVSLFAFAPENLVSRDGFGSPVPRYSIVLSAVSGGVNVVAAIGNDLPRGFSTFLLERRPGRL